MHVGMGIFIQNLNDEKDVDVFIREASIAELAEPLGFDSIWAPEHHFTDYHLCPNVIQLLTWLAGKTTRVKLGSMVVILPWHDPMRVAEELAVLDHLSGGRLVFGIGRGLGQVEFTGFRLDMEESRTQFLEYADAIVNAFATGSMEYDGKLYKQPKMALRPEPLAPLTGRMYASSGSPESMEIMGRLGLGIMVIAQKPWETTVAEVEAYRENFVKMHGHEPPKPILVNYVAVNESEQGAQEMYEKYIRRFSKSTIDHYEFDNPDLGKVKGYEYYAKITDNIERLGIEKFTGFLSDLQVWGTPEQVAEQIITNVKRIDAAGVISIFSYGGMPPDEVQESIRLFAEHVLPVLKAHDTGAEVGLVTETAPS
jgi:alkanesulfonate monooxygenase SsuD/methylene tetrahydromethanopterin reductase-like flavin-dependent oxidoreductase (luciferase family)